LEKNKNRFAIIRWSLKNGDTLATVCQL
jgi:hypothetical protein